MKMYNKNHHLCYTLTKAKIIECADLKIVYHLGIESTKTSNSRHSCLCHTCFYHRNSVLHDMWNKRQWIFSTHVLNNYHAHFLTQI